MGAEIIYVDSKSTDESIELVRTYKDIKVFLVTGECNAAIARNIGATESRNDILFFIDGDMEIERSFLSNVIINDKLIYDCVTGHLDDYLYDENGVYIGMKSRSYINKIPNEEQVLKANGGIFVIKKSVWNLVDGMNTKFRINEDNDLTLRLIRYGIKTIRVPVLICRHHTIDYNSEFRMWRDLFNFNSLYPGLLLRENISILKAWSRALRYNYTSYLFIVYLFSFIIETKYLSNYLFATYLLVLTARVFKNTIDVTVSINKIVYFIERVIYQIINDMCYWFGFLFLYPKAKKLSYIRV